MLAPYAQPLSISTPLTNAQLPFPLFINGNEVSGGVGGVIATSYRLRDPGFAGPSTLEFTIKDHTRATTWITQQQPVLWLDQANNRYMFQGYVKDVTATPVASWQEIRVTCVDMSESLDTSQPISTWDAGTHATTDQAMIQSLLANFGNLGSLGCGGYIQVLKSGMPASVPNDNTTLRNAIDQVLAATGVTGAVAYVDVFGYLHTMAIGDINAPFNISDNPDYSTTVPAQLTVTNRGAPDVDALLVQGATAAASGPIYAWQCGITTPPRSPLRWATLQAPQATDAAGQLQAATVAFLSRQTSTVVTAVISPDTTHGSLDGWAKGQYVTVTNAAIGYNAKPLTIRSVDVDVVNGKGQRRYTLIAGSDPVLFTARLKYAQAQWQYIAASGQALKGRLGGP